MVACHPLSAQGGATYYLYGAVVNSVTHKTILNTKAELFDEKGVLLDSMRNTNTTNFNGTRAPWYFSVKKKKPKNGPYRVRLTRPGYDTAYVNIPAHEANFRTFIYELPRTYLRMARKKENDTQLGEATVKATRIKFYHKGDTLVYNADAFQLAEGSMLDALIRQLPGAELKDNGRIMVNGRQVESLLLNGEDFFKGDNSIMLDNLPSYMVKSLKVYERESDLEKFAKKSIGQKPLVMDVNLKKQYSIGYIGNIQAGGGSENRYLTRLFALRFSPHSRITAFANFNNLNDNRKPGENTEWTPESMPSGLLRTQLGGIDYMIKEADGLYRFSGEAKATRSDANNLNITSSENFLPSGNTFGRSHNQNDSRYINFQTSHSASYTTERFYTNASASFNFNDSRNNAGSVSGTFNENPDLYVSDGIIDSLRKAEPTRSPLLAHLALNRTISNSRGNGRNYSGSLYSELNLKFKKYADILSFYFHGYMGSDERSDFQHYRLDYPTTASTNTGIFQNRYARTDPSKNDIFSFGSAYWFWLPWNQNLTPRYTYTRSSSKQSYNRYLLESLTGWGHDTKEPLGSLPSMTDLLTTIDRENSSHTETIKQEHLFNFNSHWEWFKKDYYLYLELNLPLTLEKNELYYRRANYNGRTRLDTWTFTPRWTSSYRRSTDDLNSDYSFTYNVGESSPDLLNHLLELENNVDPLNIRTGNENLKNRHTHELSFRSSYQFPKKERMVSYSVNYRTTVNEIANAVTYDPQTGIRHSRPENVNGNYLIWGGFNFSTPLDSLRRFTLETNTYAQLQNSVDLFSTTTVPVRSKVKTTWATETLKLTYNLRGFRIGAKGFLSYNRSTSEREGFIPQEVFDFNYGLTAQAKLPWNVTFSTDATLYSRRGYASKEANSDNFVWNARLAKHIPKASITVTLDAFDLLHNLSNTTQMMNGQGRWETFRNAIPAYLLCSVTYRLNIKPKKLPGAE